MAAESFLERNGTLFQIVAGFAFMVGAALLGWFLGQRNRKTRTLDYQILSDIAVLSHRPNGDQLKVTYEGEELDNPRVVSLRFANTGSEVIRAAEILDDYAVTFQAGWLFSAQILDQSANDLASFEIASEDVAGVVRHQIQLRLSTLNPGDYFTLQMLIDSENEAEFKIGGRIEGQTRPSGDMVAQAEGHSRLRNRWKLLCGIVLLAGGIGVMVTRPFETIWPVLLLSSGSFTAGAALAIDAWISMTSQQVRIAKGVLHLDGGAH